MDSHGASTPDDHAALARKALEEDNLHQALHHVAAALADDPNRSDWLEVLDQVIAAAGDPLDLASVEGAPPPAQLAAVHAYVLAEQGQVPEAVHELLEVISGRPDLLYLDWAVGWLQRPEAAGRIDLTKVTEFIGALLEQFSALTAPHSGGRATLDRMPFFIQVVRRTQPADSQFLTVSVALLRRLDHLEDALKLAREAHRLEPDLQTASAVAAVHEARNEIELALKAYRDALEREPQDIALRLRMADLLGNHNRLEEARQIYEEVLEQEPQEPTALPSCYFLRFVADGKEAWRDKLLALAEEEPDNERAQRLAQQVSPFVGYLPDPVDAAPHLQRAIAETGRDAGSLTRLTLPRFEAPSNYLAFDWLRTLNVTVLRTPTPDPRVPRCRVDYLLWKYDGTRPSVAVPPPEGALAWAVVEIARQPYHLEAWVQMAQRLAGQLKAEQLDDLLATMVFPPRPQQVTRTAPWVYRVQVAAALVIGQLDGAWAESTRRKALLALANGPMDWTVDAALVALSAIARREDDAVDEIERLFHELRQSLAEDEPPCYYQALLCCSLRLPNLAAEERDDLRSKWRQWQAVREAAQRYQSALEHGEKGDFVKGIEELDEVVRLTPQRADAFAARANMRLRSGKAEDALADYTKVIELEPASAAAYLGRGKAYLKRAKLDPAIEDFSAAVRLAPDDWQAYHRRGLVLAAKKEHARAITDFSKVIELAPDLPDVYQNRAFAYTDMGELELAIRDYTEQIRLAPEFAAAYNFRARLHYRQGRYAAAIGDHLRAGKLDPENANTYNQLAWIWATCPEDKQRNGPRALEHATKACELTEWKRAQFLDTLAAAHAECGHFADAVKQAEHAVELVSDAEKADYRSRLDLYRGGQPFRDK